MKEGKFVNKSPDSFDLIVQVGDCEVQFNIGAGGEFCVRAPSDDMNVEFRAANPINKDDFIIEKIG